VQEIGIKSYEIKYLGYFIIAKIMVLHKVDYILLKFLRNLCRHELPSRAIQDPLSRRLFLDTVKLICIRIEARTKQE
jgi:hypothetical protein